MTSISNSSNSNSSSNFNSTKRCSSSSSWCQWLLKAVQWTSLSTSGTWSSNTIRWWAILSTQAEVTLRSRFLIHKAESQTRQIRQVFPTRLITQLARKCLLRCGTRACIIISKCEIDQSQVASISTTPWTLPCPAAPVARTQMEATLLSVAQTFRETWIAWVNKQTQPCNWTRQNVKNKWTNLIRFTSKSPTKKKGENFWSKMLWSWAKTMLVAADYRKRLMKKFKKAIYLSVKSFWTFWMSFSQYWWLINLLTICVKNW